MRTLRAASVRHLLRHPAQLALALAGLTLGVGTIVAVDIAAASARRAFELSVSAVNGPATHQLSGGPAGIDESLYVRLVTRPLSAAPVQPHFAPVVSGYVRLGERVLELVGLDPLASSALGGEAAAGAAPAPLADLAAARRWFTEPGTVLLSATTAGQLALREGQRFAIEVAGVRREARLTGLLPAAAGFDALMLTDLAQAQEWLGAAGRLSRIDVQLPPGAEGAALEQALRAQLPPDVQLTATRARARETFAMTDAFTTNLRAMSLLALLVGTFLIYGAVSFAVLQRRTIIGVLRALGATRAEVLGVVLGEAAVLGAIGAALGTLLGLLIGRGLVALVSRTINDLYFVVAVNELALPGMTVAKALLAGLGTALVAALLPALEVAGSAPRLALARSVIEARAQRLARVLVGLAALLAALSGASIALFAHSLFAGFAALFLLLLAVAAATPAALTALARATVRLAGARSTLARLALEDVAASLSRTGVAVAALGMALTAMIGVAVMVESFRGSLEEWLVATLRADVYVSAPGPSAALSRRLEPQVAQAILALPAVRAHSEARRAVVGSPYGELDVNALRLGPAGGGFPLTAGEPRVAWRAFAAGRSAHLGTAGVAPAARPA